MACFAHIFAVSLLVSFANAICYAWLDGAAYSRDSGYYIACGVSDSNGVQSCCDKGDTCLGDSLCRSADPNPSVSGYYIAGCTDATYSNSLCSKHCSKQIMEIQSSIEMFSDHILQATIQKRT